MGTFRHNPDDYICINSTIIPLSFFITLEPAYTLPIGQIDRVYKQGICHYTTDGEDGISYTIPWTDGDTYIANEATYAAAYSLFLTPPLSLAEQKAAKIAEMSVYADTISVGHVVIGADEFFSASSDLAYLNEEYNSYYRAGALPVGYYVNDVNYLKVYMTTFPELAAVIDRIVELHYLVRVNEDYHRATINALLTIPDVLAYDYTTGWATIPY